ncbi:LacI family DNA-binding transcriptional regulator [Tumebacillus sp. ITR2]|uniref:LacI family DNA-binding transcriptional regulator n=1 Tax=Tumebacillus amylolyticus TaxID=2801339 RepID=A0ABS1J6L0_9BACL|nr:LacI family DNA-binding transcriptional regulator [Tumebacillus amylolyticus]MBL0385901.1 LacI family DNA-binding transcriptional regulator [Tumebacillus amylolyticus]
MSDKKVTIRDVAHAAGVSIATVSRYINQNFSSMSEETKLRIEEVILTLNYHPNKMAQGLKGQSRTLAVVVVNMSYPFCVSVIRSISEALNAAGYSLLVCETGDDPKRELTLLHSLVAHGVDGIILQTNGQNLKVLQDLAQKMPIVLVDRHFEIAGVKNVITNNEESSYLLTDALCTEGYECIYFISETLNGLSTRTERLAGYQRACEERSLDPHVCWVDRSDPATFEAVMEQLRQHPRQQPFAVYTSNGLLMMELYPMLTGLALQVPQEMGIATFDEPDWVKLTQPRMTCIRQPTHEIGQLAATTVLERLRGDIKAHLQPAVQTIPSVLVFSPSTQRTNEKRYDAQR